MHDGLMFYNFLINKYLILQLCTQDNQTLKGHYKVLPPLPHRSLNFTCTILILPDPIMQGQIMYFQMPIINLKN